MSDVSDREYRAYLESRPPVVRALFNAAAGCRAETLAIESDLGEMHSHIEVLEVKHAKRATEWNALERELMRLGYRLDDDGRLEEVPASHG